MHTLLRLPLILLQMALRKGAGALRDILHLAGGGADDDRPFAAAERPDPAAARRAAEVVAAEEARTRRPEARPRNAARRRPAPAPAPAPASPPAPAPAPEAELLGDEPTHVSREAETVASFGPARDPSSTLEVQPPWSGYDDQPAAEIVKRVRAGDEATRAVVLLYERGHKARASVIRAAGGQHARA
jgi:hypothetical protein